jgi:hypothetical protein
LNDRRKTRTEREERRLKNNDALSESACAKSSAHLMTSGIESARRDMSDDDERIVTGIETTIATAIAVEREIEIVTVIAHQHIALIVVFLPAAATRSEKSHPPPRTQLLRHLSMKSH